MRFGVEWGTFYDSGNLHCLVMASGWLWFTLMDGDGDGTISLTEFQVAHERIFKAMDSNKDGRLTHEEMQAFMHGTRDRFRSSRKLGRSLPRRRTLPLKRNAA
jgi:hypothetical protein